MVDLRMTAARTDRAYRSRKVGAGRNRAQKGGRSPKPERVRISGRNPQAVRDVVTLNFVSWNRIAEWLRRLDGITFVRSGRHFDKVDVQF